MALIYGYVGTYTSPEAPGTYRFRLDTQSGALDAPELIYPQANTKYAAWSQGLLAAVTEKEGAAGAALLSTEGAAPSLLDALLPEKTTACFLTWQEGLLYSANYHDGHVLIYTVKDGRLSPAHRLFVGEESGCHQVIFHGRWLLVPCLRRDKVLLFDREAGFRPAGALEFPAGTGPRHGVFTRDHRRFYLVSETSNQLFTYRVEGPAFTLEDVQPILPPDFSGKGDTAAIRLSEDERTLYISIRGAGAIAVFRVGGERPALLQHVSSQGKEPWDLLLVPGGKFLLAANRKSDAIVSFALEADGTVGPRRGSVAIPQCVGMALEVPSL